MIFFAARDLPRTEELAFLAPQEMLPLCSNPTVGIVSFGHRLRPMSNGHFPSGKAAAINSHLAPALSGGCSVFFEKIVEQQPTLRAI